MMKKKMRNVARNSSHTWEPSSCHVLEKNMTALKSASHLKITATCEGFVEMWEQKKSTTAYIKSNSD